MQTIKTRWLLVVGSLVVIFAATGCFQTAGEQLQTTSVAQSVATFTPPPPDTSEATTDVQAAVPTETSVVVEEPSPTVISGFPTLTATFTTTPEAIAQVPSPTSETSASVGQQELDSPAMTATALIINATAQAEAILTATAAAQGIGQPTPTPLFATLPPDQGGGGVIATPIPQPILPGQNCIHEVRVEDRNLWRISLYYGVTVHEIAAASGIANINLIRVGQRLTIPGCGTTGNRPPATSTPTTGGGTGVFPPVGGQVYVVRQNDTLFQISLRYGVPVQTLAAVNNIVNPNLIFIGQQIVIP